MAPSAMLEIEEPMQLPASPVYTSKPSSIIASVLHGPRDLRLVSCFPRSHCYTKIRVYTPSPFTRLLFLERRRGVGVRRAASENNRPRLTTNFAYRRTGALRTRELASCRLPLNLREFAAQTSPITRSSPMATSAPANRSPLAMSPPALSLPSALK